MSAPTLGRPSNRKGDDNPLPLTCALGAASILAQPDHLAWLAGEPARRQAREIFDVAGRHRELNRHQIVLGPHLGRDDHLKGVAKRPRLGHGPSPIQRLPFAPAFRRIELVEVGLMILVNHLEISQPLDLRLDRYPPPLLQCLEGRQGGTRDLIGISRRRKQECACQPERLRFDELEIVLQLQRRHVTMKDHVSQLMGGIHLPPRKRHLVGRQKDMWTFLFVPAAQTVQLRCPHLDGADHDADTLHKRDHIRAWPLAEPPVPPQA